MDWTIREKSYSQRRACYLASIAPRLYRYRVPSGAMMVDCVPLGHSGDDLARRSLALSFEARGDYGQSQEALSP